MRHSWLCCGWLVIALGLMTARLTAADAGLCVIFKGLFYEQTGPSTVTPLAGTRFANFRAFASMTSPNSLSSGNLRNPANQNFSLVLDGNELRFGMDFNSQANMDAAFGSGNYVLTLTTRNDGNRSFTLNLSGNTYPPIPQVSNFNALQAVVPSQPLTIQWSPWAGGTANDLILVQVEDSETWDMVFSTPEPGSPGALNGTATSITIPANTFSSNRIYNVMLMFFRPVAMDVTSYPGAMAVAGYLRETQLSFTTSGTQDTQAPWLEDQEPWNQEANVPPNAGLALKFSEPMQATYAIQWNPALSMNYQWSSDRTALFCFPASGLWPANTTVSYTLNPRGQTGFRDLAGNALPTIQGQFTTGNSTRSPDVAAYVMYKQANYQQINPTTVIASTNMLPFVIGAFAIANVPAAVTNATFLGPNSFPLVFEGEEWEGGLGTNSQANLDAAFPPGVYTFRLHTVHDGLRQLSLTLPATALPSAPQIVNYTAAQAINPQAPFTLQWQPFTGATTNDRIQVEIELQNQWLDYTVFSTPDPLGPNAINGLATSIQIPAGTLPPGRQFTAWVSFIKVVTLDTTTYPGAMGVVGFVADTTLPIATTGQPVRPSLSKIRHFGNYVRLEIQGELQMPYTVEFTENFLQWYNLRSDWNQTGTIIIEDWNLNPNRRFYRVREGW
ncbi:Ig-like domain-containing protein [Fontisphaera persica]|uniref:Ig-like domain-containing protein n=1 Tax=Fontisphaera persica TaxID=2974023 RepID=UPI0024C095DF|nr:Ig-like domain-containing protein [Fontisphaera persica]WCJ59990.1 Ig-like domain-containing protein [Fontisphaera persica]